jgi:release factor glutamine methyltransferase
MNVNQLVAKIAHIFNRTFPDLTLCQQYAWWTLEAITQKDQAHLIACNDITLTAEQQTLLDAWCTKIVDEHMPIAYLLGRVPFNDIEIEVLPPTLIPRPETEEWTVQLLDDLQQLASADITIFDLCTGTGCIALALAHGLPHATVWATDISLEAIALAYKNAQHNNVHNVTFMHSDLFNAIPREMRADIIVVNPPYISEHEWQSLDQSVIKWEDKGALVAPDNGLAIIKTIIEQAPQWLQANTALAHKNIPQLMIEIGYQQADVVVTLMKDMHYNAIHVHKDLEGKDRVVSGRVDYVGIFIKK